MITLAEKKDFQLKFQVGNSGTSAWLNYLNKRSFLKNN